MASPNLAIPHIAASQNQKEVTANDAFNRIDAKLTETLGKTFAPGDPLTWTITTEEFQTRLRFYADGSPDGPVTVTLPAVRGPFLFRNATTVAIILISGAGTQTVTLQPGDHALIYDTGAGALWAVGATGASGGSAGTLADLTDVDVTGALAGDLLSFDGAQWVRVGGAILRRAMLPFRGALVRRSTNVTIGTTGTYFPLSWETAVYDTDTLWASGSPTRLTVPPRVTKVRLVGNIEWDVSPTNQLLEIRKNGSATDGGGSVIVRGDSGYTNQMRNVASAVLPVMPGDWFELAVYIGNSATLRGGSRTWFALEIVETDDAANPPFDIAWRTDGAPAAGEVVLRTVLARPVALAADFAGSVGAAGTAATADADFDVRRNGASIGTIRFAAGSDTATFIAASAVTLQPTDLLMVVASASPDATLADVTVTLAGSLVL